MFGTLAKIRDPEDLFYEQLTTSYFASFARSGNPNPERGNLQVRGYGRVAEEIGRMGTWEDVSGKGREVRFLDWPSRSESYVDVEQCEWLGYGLDYYLKGGI